MCVDQVGGFKCLCKAGYNGANCEIGKMFEDFVHLYARMLSHEKEN